MSGQAQSDSAEPVDQDDAPEKRGSVKPVSGSGWRPLAAAAVAGLIAGVVGGIVVVGWWHPGNGAAAKFSGQQIADAKKDVCAAGLLARQVVAKNMQLKNPDPENPIAQLAVAANARLSLTGSAAYLRGRVDADAAAPRDVADAARAMAGALERLNVSYLAGQPNPDREELGRNLDARIADLGRLCG